MCITFKETDFIDLNQLYYIDYNFYYRRCQKWQCRYESLSCCSLIWVYSVCQGTLVPIFRDICIILLSRNAVYDISRHWIVHALHLMRTMLSRIFICLKPIQSNTHSNMNTIVNKTKILFVYYLIVTHLLLMIASSTLLKWTNSCLCRFHFTYHFVLRDCTGLHTREVKLFAKGGSSVASI